MAFNSNAASAQGFSGRTDDDSDARLVERIKAGDRRAAEEIVRRHSEALLARAARMLRRKEDADDAVQETFVAAFRSIGLFEGKARLGTWLLRIVVNVCLMILRRDRRRPTVPLNDHLPDASAAHGLAPTRSWAWPAEERLVQAEMRSRVRDCVDRLPAAYREVVRLRDLEELDAGRTARLLGTSRAVVKTRLHRARQALRPLLAPLFQEAT
jgi:RNA polymerase sigma-70 factor (ECF subfamily)